MLDVAMRVGFPILLGISGWTMTTLIDHDQRLTSIEASRYTRVDADHHAAGQAAINAQLAREMADLRVAVASQGSQAQARHEATMQTLNEIKRSLEAR